MNQNFEIKLEFTRWDLSIQLLPVFFPCVLGYVAVLYSVMITMLYLYSILYSWKVLCMDKHYFSTKYLKALMLLYSDSI